MNFLAHKGGRLAVFYVLLCAGALAYSRSERLSLCPDWRFAALRELMKPSTATPDVLFLGSSRTVRGVVPAAFERALATDGGAAPLTSLNLAVNGTPRHANYLQLRDWLRDHPAPKVVCVEVGVPDIIDWPHQMLPRFIDARDALRLVVERPYLVETQSAAGRHRVNDPGFEPNVWLQIARTGLHIELALNALGRGPEDIVRAGFDGLANAWEEWRHGKGLGGALGELGNPYWATEPPIEPATLAQEIDDRGWYRVDPDSELGRNGKRGVERKAKQISLEDAIAPTAVLVQDIAKPPRFGATRLYTALLADLCRERGIRLVFMYLPGFRQKDLLSPSQIALYESRGELFVPDLANLQREEMYQDEGHLTIEGAEHYSAELARFVAR
jgi:hypothetical protein